MARGRSPYDDDGDDAPWLAEGVREERATTLVPRGRLIGGVLLFVALLVLVGLGIYMIAGRKADGSGGFARPEDAPLIAADAGPVKVAPLDPGGATVTGASDTVAAAGRGDDPSGSIDLGGDPEEPLARPGTTPPVDLLPPGVDAAEPPTIAPPAIPAPIQIKPAPVKPPAPKPEPVKPVARPEPVVKPATGSASLQLGAFSSAAKADAAWRSVSGRFAAVAALGKSVDPVTRDGATLYRLRASGLSSAAATDLCARLKAAGDACIVAE